MSESKDAEPMVVLITAGNREEAARLAEMLVGARLAACVQIMPEMESVYRWKGKVQRDPEILLLVKTARACFAELEREVRALHTYESPEIIALPVTEASAPYLKWLTETVGRRLPSRSVARSASVSAERAKGS